MNNYFISDVRASQIPTSIPWKLNNQDGSILDQNGFTDYCFRNNLTVVSLEETSVPGIMKPTFQPPVAADLHEIVAEEVRTITTELVDIVVGNETNDTASFTRTNLSNPTELHHILIGPTSVINCPDVFMYRWSGPIAASPMYGDYTLVVAAPSPEIARERALARFPSGDMRDIITNNPPVVVPDGIVVIAPDC